VTRLVRRAAFGALAIATLATIAVAFVSFARKVDSFSGAGFTASADGGSLLLTSVDPQGAAGRAGLRAGDRIILADGQTASSLSNPSKALSRPPLPHRLVVI